MNPSADLQLENWARYGHALGHAAANVVHEVNAPLGVALARMQLALRLLDKLPGELATELNEQLHGCEAAIRSSATVVRDLNYLRYELDSSNDSAFVTHVLNAAHQLALLDATHAGCQLSIHLPEKDFQVAGDSQHLLVLLLELIWERVSSGAMHISFTLETGQSAEELAPRIVVVSDEKKICDDVTRRWLDSLAALCGARIAWQQTHRCTTCIVSLEVNYELSSLRQGTN